MNTEINEKFLAAQRETDPWRKARLFKEARQALQNQPVDASIDHRTCNVVSSGYTAPPAPVASATSYLGDDISLDFVKDNRMTAETKLTRLLERIPRAIAEKLQRGKVTIWDRISALVKFGKD
jgi:hypothetical protein